MQKTLPVFTLFAIIILEGYVVLSSELLAIRQTIPFVGSGTDTVSIIIAAVLMPLAFGYQAGGQFRPGYDERGRYVTIRRKLIKNLFISLCILTAGLSYFFINVFFITILENGIQNRLALTAIYSALFLVTPVYLLGQTIPLISNYFSKEKLARITGKILFFSTFGSFIGAVFSTLILMATIGVHHTATLNLIILAALIWLLNKNKNGEIVLLSAALAITGACLNSDYVMRAFKIVENNTYNTIMVLEDDDGTRNLVLNNNSSSQYRDDGKKHEYIEYMEGLSIHHPTASGEPLEILVIGAGAFTFGAEDNFNHYEFVDIDKSLKEISEEHILKKKLGENKEFFPMPARAFLAQTDKHYDLIILDAYLGALTLPEHLVTQEFFAAVKSHVKDGGAVIGNFILSETFANAFTRNIDTTLRSVFPNISREVLSDTYNVWEDTPEKMNNVIYVYKHRPSAKPSIYTDNKNRVFYDRPKRQAAEAE